MRNREANSEFQTTDDTSSPTVAVVRKVFAPEQIPLWLLLLLTLVNVTNGFCSRGLAQPFSFMMAFSDKEFVDRLLVNLKSVEKRLTGDNLVKFKTHVSI